jgi:hypothetical protein
MPTRGVDEAGGDEVDAPRFELELLAEGVACDLELQCQLLATASRTACAPGGLEADGGAASR